jgi:hypothetical protein
MFCIVVLGFLGAAEMIGVTSFCRFFGFEAKGYHALLHFFRSSAWSLSAMLMCWSAFVFSQNLTVTVNGRAVFLGDHIYIPKDGRRMPGLVSLRQHSETQTKPSYFRGHCWGGIGVLIGSLAVPFCLPLHMALHQGQTHIGESKKNDGKTLGTRIVQMALDVAIKNDIPGILILDAFFPSWAVFRLAASVCAIATRQPLMTLIVRAKKGFVAYFPAENTGPKKRGKPRVYGEKVKLMEMFDHLHLFSRVSCTIYGRTEEIMILSADLLWKPAKAMLRFVFAITSRGPIVLMCNDLTMEPVMVLELYCTRVRIEGMFDMLKNLIGAFCYRFWTKRIEASSRKPKKNSTLVSPAPENLPVVRQCWDAYERFVMLGVIALGLLQLIALRFTSEVWTRFDGFLRTRSRCIPSERTVRYVISKLLLINYLSLAPSAILKEIRKRFLERKSTPPDP